MQIAKDHVVTFHYQLDHADGRAIENSREGDPVAYLHGHDNIIAGLEREMAGKQVGDQFSVTLAAADAYGERNPEAVQRIPVKHLQLKGKPKPGMMAWVQTDQGPRQVTVIKPGRFMVEVDTNHPLAGSDLTFQVEIVEIRPATAEEVEHGHAHGVGGHQH